MRLDKKKKTKKTETDVQRRNRCGKKLPQFRGKKRTKNSSVISEIY